MKKYCKICKRELLKRQKIYCSNKCKFNDVTYNKSRNHKIKNDPNYKLVCKQCNWETTDINNLSGTLTTHEHSDFEKIKTKKVILFQCPDCKWTTKDLINKSGCFTTHLKKVHNSTPEEFMEIHPELEHLWQLRKINIERTKFLQIEEHRIQCKICNKMFMKLSNTHLKKHNITPNEYKIKYDVDNTTSAYTSNLQSLSVDRKALSKKIKELNQKKWGVNSYTQTTEGKSRVLKTTLKRNFKNYLESSFLTDNLEILFTESEYTGVVGKLYPFKCKKCYTEFRGSLENGKLPRCLTCYPITSGGPSKAEKEIYYWLQHNYDDEIITNNRKILNSGKELDIYLPDKKIAIEYDGIYWHSELNGKGQNYHLDKTIECESNGIRLIHIFEDEWVYKQNIVKNRLVSILKLNTRRLYARNCEIRELSVFDKNTFLTEYHLQGLDRSKIKLGLFYDNTLLSLMTFSNYKYKKMDTSVYELSRFVVGDVNIVGGFSKLLKYFIRIHNPTKIISFADKRWVDMNNNVYLSNNFNLINTVKPSYWYIINGARTHRFNFRKNVLKNKLKIYDVNLTEWQNMQLNGYDRIWDCGNLKYEFTK